MEHRAFPDTVGGPGLEDRGSCTETHKGMCIRLGEEPRTEASLERSQEKRPWLIHPQRNSLWTSEGPGMVLSSTGATRRKLVNIGQRG